MDSLGWAFRVASIWLLLAGMTLLFPILADRVFALHLTNWGLASEYGGVLLVVGILYWAFSNDTERYGPITGIMAFGMLLNSVINAYWWLVGHYSLQNALLNVVANAGLALWLWTARTNKQTATGMPQI